MAPVDFSDEDAGKAWFETQSVETRCAISSRAALRVVSNYRFERRGGLDELDLSLFRAILTSAGRGSGRSTDVDWGSPALSAAKSARSALSAANSAVSAANSALSAANSAASSAANSSTYSTARSALSAARSAARSALSAASSSALSAVAWDTRNIAVLNDRAAWPTGDIPAAISKNHADLLVKLASDPAWAFWLRFYQGMWDGTFDDWDVAFEVIKIPDEDWDKGYQHIGAVIAGIARSQTADAVADLRLSSVSRLGIGGNHPPADEKLDEALSQIQQGASVIEREVVAEMPDEAAVARGLGLLGDGLKALLLWLGRKGDLTVDQLIKWGVPAACAHLVLNPQKVQALINAAKAWLPLI